MLRLAVGFGLFCLKLSKLRIEKDGDRVLVVAVAAGAWCRSTKHLSIISRIFHIVLCDMQMFDKNAEFQEQ